MARQKKNSKKSENANLIKVLDDTIKKYGAKSVTSELKKMLESKEITGEEYEKILTISSHLTFERLAPATKEELMKSVSELKEKHDKFMEFAKKMK